MITMFLDAKVAALPEDLDLTLEFENPFFTKNGSYSYTIDLDLTVRQNQEIFGHINRLAVPKNSVKMPCLIYKNDRLYFVGNATIMSVTDTSVSIQLLGDSSSIHFFSKDIYLDEMELGDVVIPFSKDITRDIETNLSAAEVQALFGSVDVADAVFFAASYYNRAIDNGWADAFYPNGYNHSVSGTMNMYLPRHFSVQPYLIRVFERVVSAMGYTLTRNDWNDTWLRNLYITNCKRGQWTYDDGLHESMAKALPHWSVSKFLDELEKLLAVIILVDEHRKQVQVVSLDTFYQGMAIVDIPSDRVLDAYEVNLEQSDTNKSLSSGNIGFNHTYRDKFMQVDVQQLQAGTLVEYDSYDAVKTAFSSLDDKTKARQIFKDSSTGRLYVAYTKDDALALRECNVFGNLSRDGSDDTDVELNIVPADTKSASIRLWSGPNLDTQQYVDVILPYQDNEVPTAATSDEPSDTMENIILNGAPTEKNTEEVMEVMISTGESYQLTTYSGEPCCYPQSFTDHNIPMSGRSNLPQMSLSLHDVCEQSLGHRFRQIPVFDTSRPFRMTFFHPDKIETRNILRIRNQRYVIRQLTLKMSASNELNCYEAELYRLE